MRKSRLAVAVLAAVAILVSFAAPAAAEGPFRPGLCNLWQRTVYTVTASGGLTASTFCLEPNRDISRWPGSETVATEGWSETKAVFWSGVTHGTGVFYRVTGSSGALMWSADLQTWQPLGLTAATDWRDYRSLISPEPGVIYGVDGAGIVRRWVHAGWEAGEDTWGPTTVAGRLPAGTRLLGRTDEGFFAVDPAQPRMVRNWTAGFKRGALQITLPASAVPGSVSPFSFGKFATSAFATTRTGQLALLLPDSCSASNRVWAVDSEISSDARLVFPGEYRRNGAGPVEWQCAAP